MNQSNKLVMLVGGGTGGPVTPLLAVATELKRLQPDLDYVFVGTTYGPEQDMVTAAGIKFESMPAAKLRRYFSWSNFTDIFVFIKSLFVARKLLKQYKPNIVVGAGGYVAVPVSWMARFMKIPVLMHQQDALVGLANRLIWPVANLVTTSLEDTAKQFDKANNNLPSGRPVVAWVGNPVRPEFFGSVDTSMTAKLGLNSTQNILLVVGGATGADDLNKIVVGALPELVKTYQVVHLTGIGKNTATFTHINYHPFEFLNAEYPNAFKLANLIISRAGLSTISELSAAGKPAIVVPIPNSHQENNAQVLIQHNAAVVVNQKDLSSENLPQIVAELTHDITKQAQIRTSIAGIMPHDAASKIANLILQTLKPQI